MTRVLLVSPPFYRLLGGHNNWPALGLSYLAAVLNRYDVDARVYYADRVPGREHINLRSIFEGQARYTRLINDPDHALWADTVEQVLAFDPALVGFSLTTPTFKGAAQLARLIKARNPQIQIVAGGPHATFMAQAVLDDPAFDGVVRGEGG